MGAGVVQPSEVIEGEIDPCKKGQKTLLWGPFREKACKPGGVYRFC